MSNKIVPVSKILKTFLEDVQEDMKPAEKGAMTKRHNIKSANPEDKDKYKDMPPSRFDKDGKEKELDEAAFSRQHYEAIAEILKTAMENTKDKEAAYPVIQEIRQKLIEMFSADNKSFDKNKFLTASKFQVGGKFI